MKKNNKKIIVIVIVIISIIVIFLGGYIINKKVLSKKEINITNTGNINTPNYNNGEEILTEQEVNEINDFFNIDTNSRGTIMQFVTFKEPSKLLEKNSNNKYYLQMILESSKYVLRTEDDGMGIAYITLDGIKQELKELTNYDYNDKDIKEYFKEFYQTNSNEYRITMVNGAPTGGKMKTGYRIDDKYYITLSTGTNIVLQKIVDQYYYSSCISK